VNTGRCHLLAPSARLLSRLETSVDPELSVLRGAFSPDRATGGMITWRMSTRQLKAMNRLEAIVPRDAAMP
jgi:hypothetical protein